MKRVLLALAVLAALAGGTSAAQARPRACASPALFSATPIGQSQVELVYSGVCGPTVKTKEKRADLSGACGSVAGCNAYYFNSNTGDVTVTSVYGPGLASFRVCDVSGPTDVCSNARLVTVT